MKLIQIKNIGLLSALFATAIFIYACDSSGGSSGASSSTSFDFSSAAVSSPFVSTSTSSQIIRGSITTDNNFSAIQDAISNLTETVTDAEDCVFDLDLITAGSRANCFGPNLELIGTHPDGALPAFGTPPNPLPTGDLGIFNTTDGDSDQACGAAQFTAIMGYTSQATFAQLASAAAYCYARVNSLSIPASASDSSLTFDSTQLTEFGFSDGDTPFEADSVVMSPTTTSDGDFALQVAITGTIDSKEFETSLSYYSDSSTGEFSGKANYLIRESALSENNCGATGLTGITPAGTMYFSRTSSSADVKITLNSASFCGTEYDPFITDDAVDFCDTRDGAVSSASDVGNGWGGNWVYLNFEFDPDTLVGSYIQSWQAGPNDGFGRNFNVVVDSATSATAYFGYGTAIGAGSAGSCTAADTPGAIEGMICNWAGPGAADKATSLASNAFVQRQTLVENSGSWEVDSEQIRYAPVNDCDDVAGTGGDGLQWSSLSNQSDNTSDLNYTNDDDPADGVSGVTDGSNVLDLESLTDYQADFTAPSEASF